jgi:hypothetical protein
MKCRRLCFRTFIPTNFKKLNGLLLLPINFNSESKMVYYSAKTLDRSWRWNRVVREGARPLLWPKYTMWTCNETEKRTEIKWTTDMTKMTDDWKPAQKTLHVNEILECIEQNQWKQMRARKQRVEAVKQPLSFTQWHLWSGRDIYRHHTDRRTRHMILWGKVFMPCRRVLARQALQS